MDIKESYRGWHDKIGYIPQTIYMLDDTIRNNIAFGKVKSIDDAEIWAALKQAQLDEFVKSLDEGLDTMIGEAGGTLIRWTASAYRYCTCAIPQTGSVSAG